MKKKIKERQTTKSEMKDTSPYWHWVRQHQKSDSDGQLIEPVEANPDSLAEEDGLWSQSESSQDFEIKKQKLKKALKYVLSRMTKTDRELVTLMSQGIFNISKLSEKMGVSKSFIYNRVSEIRKNVDKLQ